LNEGIAEQRIFVTGNTVVDAVFQNLEISKSEVNVLSELRLRSGEYFAATIHRQENVDDEERLRCIVKGLERVREHFGLELIYPVHPRARKLLKEFGMDPSGVRLIEPLDYLSFLQLESNARLVLTDSGGVQEEACILGVPCVTLRDNTERPETLDVGSNILAGTDPDRTVDTVNHMLRKSAGWKNPFGDGRAGERIVEILRRVLD
jgi:UDP-N-acetylglucosamine 2-epimerase (non-hydrolysing)